MFEVTSYTVREWIRSGDILASKVDGVWTIKYSDVVAYANRRYGEQNANQ